MLRTPRAGRLILPPIIALGDVLLIENRSSWVEATNLITVDTLNSRTSKDLAQQAKKSGVPGWHSMRKQQLIRALLTIAKQKKLPKSKPSGRIQSKRFPPTGSASAKTGRSATGNRAGAARRSGSAIARKIRADREHRENLKNLALIATLDRSQQVPASDRLILIVRDSFWLQAYWEITKSTVQRAKVALSGDWHEVKPVLRLYEITSDRNTNAVEHFVQEIEIHGGVKNWYVSIKDPAKSYRIAIGYATLSGKFHLICKSNCVCTPPAKASALDENWTDITNDVEKYYALSGGFDDNAVTTDLQAVFEEKSRQPMYAPAFERLGSGINGSLAEFEFHVEAHMIVYGTTDPSGNITVAGEPVRLQQDGSFSLKVDLPDRRQVLPVVASSRDGTQQRTTVLAVERNTKVMEPVTNSIEGN